MLLNKGNCDQDYLHKCRVRELCRLRNVYGLNKFREYVQKSHFDEQVWRDFTHQWKLGNKGEVGRWELTKSSLQQQEQGTLL